MNGSGQTMQYLDPTLRRLDADVSAAPVARLRGKWIAFVDNGWKSFGKIGVRMEEVLRLHHGIAGMRVYPVPTSPGPPPELFDRIVRECDAAVVGLAN